MIKPDGERPEKSVEIYKTPASSRVIQVRAAAFFEIDYDIESVYQDMFFKYGQSPRTVLDGGFRFGNATPLFLLAGRFCEDRRHILRWYPVGSFRLSESRV